MTLNSYRDPELRDRRSVFVRHPLGTALGTVLGAFLLLAPVAAVFGRTDQVGVRTAQLPGGVIEAGVLVADADTTSSTSSAASVAATEPVTVATPETTTTATPESAPTTEEPTTVKKKAPATTAARPATTVAKPKPTTTTAKPKATATTAKPKPTTTVPAKPTTTVPKPTTTTTTVFVPTVYSAAQSEAFIRQVWPDELEEKALVVAVRESTLRNTAHNWCCYGLFQINFGAHRAWLASLGITRPEQLYDPTINARIAYALYLRSGWVPWGG